MLGRATQTLETTAFRPRSPYGVAKVYATTSPSTTARATACFAATACLFNHEARDRRRNLRHAEDHQAAVRSTTGEQHELLLGNLDAERDWGYARTTSAL